MLPDESMAIRPPAAPVWARVWMVMAAGPLLMLKLTGEFLNADIPAAGVVLATQPDATNELTWVLEVPGVRLPAAIWLLAVARSRPDTSGTVTLPGETT